MAGKVIPLVYDKLPIKIIPLYFKMDGTFPNHHPDPTVDSNLVDLQNFILDNNCDLGIAFDGDADRILIIDENAKIVNGDEILYILAKANLDNPKFNSKVVVQIAL